MNATVPGTIFRKVFILESRDWWSVVPSGYDPEQDLVLTYDFGLKEDIRKMGGRAEYIDHLLSTDSMQQNNFMVYRFFRDWHKRKDGSDLFSHREIPFGFAFRMEIWNDLLFYVRNRLCLEVLRELIFETLFVGTHRAYVENMLNEMAVPFVALQIEVTGSAPYFFPIARWMDERIRIKTVRHQMRDWVTSLLGRFTDVMDTLTGMRRRPAVFVQEYHPTRALLQELKKDSSVRLVLAHYSWPRKLFNFLTERPIPLRQKREAFEEEARHLFEVFSREKCAKLVLANGLDLTDQVYQVIEERIAECIPDTLRVLESVIHFLDRNPLRLEVLIGNIGQVATLVDCVCKARNVPSYLIINGLLGNAYLDEGKYASFINSYSISVKKNYFGDKDNVVCLGDPRMDAYGAADKVRKIDRVNPTITIGASGFNPTDLNSYVAVEFDFLYDLLLTIRGHERCSKQKVIIKVRPNGYRSQYVAFVEEYFSDLSVEVQDKVSMREVLDRTDFYISIYSQTLFEASCMGIPCLYYKKDTEIMDPPFDGRSELVTVASLDSLSQALDDFCSGHPRYDAFLQRSVIEKYVGPTDGNNLVRNLSYIQKLVANIVS